MDEAAKQFHEAPSRIDWSRIDPYTMRLALEIGKRAAAICRDWIARKQLVELDPRRFIEPDAQTITMDVCIYMMSRGCDLERWLDAPVEPFLHDFALLQQRINRVDGIVPEDVPFLYANSARKK